MKKSTDAKDAFVLDIQRGESLALIGRKLVAGDVLSGDELFRAYARITGLDKRLRPGNIDTSRVFSFVNSFIDKRWKNNDSQSKGKRRHNGEHVIERAAIVGHVSK